MFYLIYDSEMSYGTTIHEEFNTIKELVERYKEIQYDVYNLEVWKDNKIINLEDKENIDDN